MHIVSRQPKKTSPITMDKKQAIMLAKQYKEYIAGWFDGPKVYLYGSYSKDCARTDSRT